MTTSITTAFIGDYNADVHHVFQREGSMLKPGVFVKSDVVGSTVYFQKLGSGAGSTKGRNGLVTPMNLTHTQPSGTLVDLYAGEWIDRLDEAKTNIEVRMNYAKAGAYALGRDVDNQITTVLDTTTQTTITLTVTSAANIQAGLIGMTEALDSNSVPNDGQRYGALTPRMWAQAMTVTSFANADYVGPNGLPFTEGAPGHRRFKSWMGVNWCMHPGLPGKGTATAKCFVWHRDSVGYGVGKHAKNIASNEAVSADIQWHNDHASHFVLHCMSGVAVMIDDTGVIEGNLDDTAAIATS